MTLKSFEWDKLRGIVWDFNKQEETVEEFRKFIAQYISEIPTTGLTLIGNYGTGKTHLSIAIVKEFIMKHHLYTRVRSFPLLLQELRESYDGQGITRAMKMYTTIPLLLIDEIGKEKISDWVSEIMFLLIDGRIKNKVPTIITSNYSLEEVEETYGGAITSRLLQGSAVIQLRGNDYRETIQIEMQTESMELAKF
ncbi:MAG: ATP-binding protein [Planctomycetes bacterium]|nr:ATP-binding protein [Planctomycetota bacterium]